MKLLITGGNGFLGRRAAAHFKMLGFQVLTPSHPELDITQEDAVLQWFRENRLEAVIHTAAISDTGLCQQKPQWSEAVNVDGCVHLARACAQTGAKLILARCLAAKEQYHNAKELAYEVMHASGADPLLAELQQTVASLEVKEGEQDFSCLKALYSRTDVFGVDVYALGLGEKIEGMVAELYAGPGAVRKTLHKYVSAR